MDLLCFFSVFCLLCLCVRLFICALWSPAGKELSSWLSFVVSNRECVIFPIDILGHVWYLIVSIPDLCTLTYFPMIFRIYILNRHSILSLICNVSEGPLNDDCKTTNSECLW